MLQPATANRLDPGAFPARQLIAAIAAIIHLVLLVVAHRPARIGTARVTPRARVFGPSTPFAYCAHIYAKRPAGKRLHFRIDMHPRPG